MCVSPPDYDTTLEYISTITLIHLFESQHMNCIGYGPSSCYTIDVSIVNNAETLPAEENSGTDKDGDEGDHLRSFHHT